MSYHHVLMALLTVSAILFCKYEHIMHKVHVLSQRRATAILLAGCTAESLRDLYLLSFSYTGSATTVADNTMTSSNVSLAIAGLAGNGAALQVRVGYFGYCLVHGAVTTCSTDADSLAALLQGAGWSDPLNLLYVAKSFHNDTIFSGLMSVTPSSPHPSPLDTVI
jgi:ABC-type uncharacterized transport system auxiliary subunit